MKIRPMSESDQLEVCRVLCACYRLLGRIEGLSPEAVEFLLSERGSLESIQRESACQTFLVAEVEQRIVGMVAVNGSLVAKLYVDPPYHGRGIGTALFRAAEAIVLQGGYDHLTLGAAPSAVGFYRAMGAAVTGRKPPSRGPLAAHRPFLMRKHLAPM
jgi:ribosomal protein S18 acetylase RimI-like enzyme